MAAGSALGLEHPADISAALAAASGAPALLATLPWVAAYLTFLPRHPAAAVSQCFRCSSANCKVCTPPPGTMCSAAHVAQLNTAAVCTHAVDCFAARNVAQQLAALRAAPTLQPGAAAFGPAALCLRSALDDALSRLPPQRAPEQPASIAAGQLAAADATLSGRFMQLACPPLQLFRAQSQVCFHTLRRSSSSSPAAVGALDAPSCFVRTSACMPVANTAALRQPEWGNAAVDSMGWHVDCNLHCF
jgi:hypothetical protein